MSIAEAIQNIGFLTDLRESALVYPIIMTTHLSCIAVFGGLILMTDLRLLNVALRSRPVSDVINQFRVWKRVGFVIMVTMGALLASCEAVKYSDNPFFWCKMACLILVGVHALIFRKTVYNHPEEIDKAPVIPARAKAAGALSLVIWLSVLSFGRPIGYYEPKKDVTQVPSSPAAAMKARR